MEGNLDLDETLPDTQPVDDGCFGIGNAVYSQSSQSQKNHWGRLYPLMSSLQLYDLVEEKVTFGKTSSCSIVVTKEQVGKDNFLFLSKLHFEITRTTVSGRIKVQAYDKSRHGLFVNGRKIGKTPSKNVLLCSGDVIGFPANPSGALYEAYVFVNEFESEKDYIPQGVTKQYEVTKRLGKGAFGEVYLTFNKVTGHASAMKTILYNRLVNDDKHRDKLLNEMSILKSLDYPHIIKLVDVVEIGKESYMFLEYMPGKDLCERILREGQLKENLAKLLFYQLSLGVKYLHDHRIIHRDIKPPNVLLASNKEETLVKLTDFGLSKALSSTIHMKTMCGTKMYAAPELLASKSKGKYTASVDVWSLGVLLYFSLSGTEPFATEPHLIEKHIMSGLYVMTPEKWRDISIFAKNLIDSMLMVDPNKRKGIDNILEDKWLKDDSMHSKLKDLYKAFGYDDVKANHTPLLSKSKSDNG